MLSLGSVASYSRAIQFVGTSSGTSTPLTLPTNLEPNDLMLVMQLNSVDTPLESGWTLGGSGTSGALTYSWFWKYYESGDTSFETDGTRPRMCAAFRNVDPMYPFDTAATTADGGGANTGDPDAPSITTVNPSSIVVALGWQDDDSVAASAPDGYRLIGSQVGSASVGVVSMAFKEVSVAGAENPPVFGDGGSDDWAATSIALRSSAYAQQMVAYSSTGTLVHTYGGYKYHVFTSSTSTFHVVSTGTVDKIEVLCVAGGGGGGEGASGGGGGGGGAGGVEMLAVTPSATNYAIAIGAGGAGATANTAKGTSGSTSSFDSPAITTVGGGGGGSSGVVGVRDGESGGSGGGGAGLSSAAGVGGVRLVVGEGSAGGDGGIGNGGGGGGGAGGGGGNATTTDTGGTGGTGTDAYSTWFTHITNAGGATYGENGFIASGGGGGGDVTGGTSPDGGGANGVAGATNATNATVNTGGGGGGSETGNGSNGGSGIVIVRYRHVALG